MGALVKGRLLASLPVPPQHPPRPREIALSRLFAGVPQTPTQLPRLRAAQPSQQAKREAAKPQPGAPTTSASAKRLSSTELQLLRDKTRELHQCAVKRERELGGELIAASAGGDLVRVAHLRRQLVEAQVRRQQLQLQFMQLGSELLNQRRAAR
ncbi:hypothetical protein [Actimicrobium sp. GrIS 1.19]|uniref:hypothetical protein n=1 Tax=Actimicrobium sp. GrIS 1.19 TaxID=3071708 RepID=UPI002E0EE222